MGKPYGNHWLTEEQKKRTGDNIGLVYYRCNEAIKRGKVLPRYRDDLLSYLFLDFCIANEKYKENGEATYNHFICICLDNSILSFLRQNSRHYERYKFINFEEKKEEDLDNLLIPLFYDKRKTDINWLLEKVDLSEIEKEIIDLYYRKGKLTEDIAGIRNCTAQCISYHLSRIHKKVNNWAKENEYFREDFY